MTTTAERAARHWERMASEQREWAAYESSRGEYAGVHLTRARIYDRTAESIRLTERTGVPHCACHLIPVSEAIRLYDKPLGGRR